MANNFKEIKTRIALKQNTYEYWITGAGKDYIPLYGEVCFCEIPTPEENKNPQTNGAQEATNAPTVLFKVGTAQKNADGSWVEGTNKKFSELNWVSALAADVYDWAKQSPEKFLEWLGEQNQLSVIWDTEDYKGTKTYTLAEYAEEVIGNPSNLTTISKNLVGAINEAYQAVNVGGIGSVVTIAKLATPTTGSYATYQLYQGVDDNNHPIAVGAKIEIPMPTISKAETPTEGAQATYEIKYGNTTANGKIDIPESAKVETSDKNGYIKVDNEEVQVFDDVFKADGKTVVAAGGIAAGSDVNGKTFQQILYNMMYPYQKPTISASASPNGGTYEKGNTQTITSVTATVTKKTEEIAKVELYNGSTLVATKNGTDTLSSSSSALVKNGGAVKFEGLTREVSANGGQYKAKVYDITGGTAEANTGSFSFINAFYYGVCAPTATIDGALIIGLTKDLSAKPNATTKKKTYTYTTNSQRMVVAYPKSYGKLVFIKDGSGLDNSNAFGEPLTVSVTNSYDVVEDYYVYANGVTAVKDFKMNFGFYAE